MWRRARRSASICRIFARPASSSAARCRFCARVPTSTSWPVLRLRFISGWLDGGREVEDVARSGGYHRRGQVDPPEQIGRVRAVLPDGPRNRAADRERMLGLELVFDTIGLRQRDAEGRDVAVRQRRDS